MSLANLINDRHRRLTGLSPAERIRLDAKARNLSASDAGEVKRFVDESCNAMSRRLDELVEKALVEIGAAVQETTKK